MFICVKVDRYTWYDWSSTSVLAQSQNRSDPKSNNQQCEMNKVKGMVENQMDHWGSILICASR